MMDIWFSQMPQQTCIENNSKQMFGKIMGYHKDAFCFHGYKENFNTDAN